RRLGLSAAERRQSLARGASPWTSERGSEEAPEGRQSPAPVAPPGLHFLCDVSQGLAPLANNCRRYAAPGLNGTSRYAGELAASVAGRPRGSSRPHRLEPAGPGQAGG